ncbi:MAG TPA: hypothetical protein VK862_14330 [Afifellaceae bacterium]|nr:hypothetical protein [Afifellaceae bacterium]
MTFRHNGTEYTCIIGSDLDRDGMYVEVTELADVTNALLEIFYSDETEEMTLSTLRPDVPLEVVEWAIPIARERLPINGLSRRSS